MVDNAHIKQEVSKAAEHFRRELASRSFSERNLDLGKMVKCHLCGRRHRQVEIQECELRVKTIKELKPSRFSVVGRKPFNGKRINPHYSKRRLQLLDLTIQLFPEHEPYWQDKTYAMKLARREARETLERKRDAASKKRRDMQHESRKANRLSAGKK